LRTTRDDAQSEIEIFVSTDNTTMKPEKNSRTPGLNRFSTTVKIWFLI